MRYEDLERQAQPRRIRDWSDKWGQLTPIGDVNGDARAAIVGFCERKGITFEALEQLGTRLAVRPGGYHLAYAGTNRDNVVTAVKYRPLTGSSHDSVAEKPSAWIRPIVIGKRDSLDWILAEGETDAARLYDLLGDVAAVITLPTGARARFQSEWAAVIPRGATVFLAEDADLDGDAHAEKTATMLGSHAVRLRPPDGAKDWCEWRGSRDEFLALGKAALQQARATHGWITLADVTIKPVEFVEKPFLQKAAFHLLAGIKNAGKGTCLAHYAARLTRGELGERRHVIWISLGEDSYAIDVKPRIVAAGGDPGRVTVLEGGTLTLPGDVGELKRKADELGDVGLIIIDPIAGGLASGKSTNFDADVRPALAALNLLADTTEAMVFGVRHISIKPDRRAGGTLAAVLGSSDWVNVPRAVLALVHDDVDANSRHLFVVAGNRVQGDTAGVMFRIEGHVLPGFTEEVTRAAFLGESSKDPDELLTAKRKRKDSKSDAGRRLILEVLAGAEDAQMESDSLDAHIAKQTGLTAKTVQNIRSEMRKEGLVRSVPDKDEFGEIKQWFVTLTGAAHALLADPHPEAPPTYDLSGSGLDNPHPDSACVGNWNKSGSGTSLSNGDFVTGSDA